MKSNYELLHSMNNVQFTNVQLVKSNYELGIRNYELKKGKERKKS